MPVKNPILIKRMVIDSSDSSYGIYSDDGTTIVDSDGNITAPVTTTDLTTTGDTVLGDDITNDTLVSNVITSTFNSPISTFVSPSAGATGPTLALKHDSLTPAVSDVVGRLLFIGNDDAGAAEDYAKIDTILLDPAAANPDASMVFYTDVAGTLTQQMALSNAVLTLGVASSTTGGLTYNNASNANTVTLQSGVTSGSYTMTLPLAVAGAGEVLTDAAGDGVLSWASVGVPTAITVADESADTTCFPSFFTAATGDLGPKTDTSNYTYNSNTGALSCTSFVGALTGQADTVGTITGLAPDTATTQATQPNITSLGILTDLVITVADTTNKIGLTVIQNDVTNDPDAFHIINNATGTALKVESTEGGTGVYIAEYYHNAASVNDFDELRTHYYFNNDAAQKTLVAKGVVFMDDVTDGSEDGVYAISVKQAGALKSLFTVGGVVQTGRVHGITVGAGATGVVAGNLNQDLQLISGNATTGIITITATGFDYTGIAYTSEIDNGNSGAADTIDWTTGNIQKSTLTDNVTYTFTAPTGPAHLTIRMIQDAGGTNTVTWPATVKWSGGTEPTWDTTGDRENYAFFYFNGANYIGSAVVNITP